MSHFCKPITTREQKHRACTQHSYSFTIKCDFLKCCVDIFNRMCMIIFLRLESVVVCDCRRFYSPPPCICEQNWCNVTEISHVQIYASTQAYQSLSLLLTYPKKASNSSWLIFILYIASTFIYCFCWNKKYSFWIQIIMQTVLSINV